MRTNDSQAAHQILVRADAQAQACLAYVANYHNIDGFSIDADSGVLVPLETSPLLAGDSTGVDLQMDPSAQFLHAANHDSGAVTVLAVDSNSGELTPSSAAPSPGFPLAIALRDCTR